MPVLTIDVPAAKAARVAVALGAHLGLKRSATMLEVKLFVITVLKQVVENQEAIVAKQAFVPDPLGMT